MKRNNLNLCTLAFAACALLLGACSNEWSTTDNPNHAGAGEAIVQVSLQFPQADKPGGYAVGDVGDKVPEGVALDEEKEIRSIAFIAFTAGGTGIYLSTNDALTDQGFTEPLTAVEGKKGEYTAKFKIKSSTFGPTTTIVAIANFFEHGLKDAIEASGLTEEGLKAMLSDALMADKSIGYPLLMTMAKTLPITEGATITAAECPFIMERIMARVDVVNNAYDKAAPTNNFVLTSARLLSAPTHGTMIGGQAITDPAFKYVDTKSYTTIQEIAPANAQPVTPENPAKQQLEPMYVYENKNTGTDDATKLSTATSIEVTGTYQGQTYTKVIPFMTAKTPENPTGTIVPIARNTRYVVEITRTTESKLEFGVKVTDWAKGENLDVGIDFAAPTLDGFKITPGTGTGATITEVDGVNTLNITNATAATELKFTVNGYQDTDFTSEIEYDENKTKVIDGIKVDRSDLSGYASGASATPENGPLHREYTITVPPAVGEYPSNTKIIVYNSAYADAATEINVKYTPVFITDLKSSQTAATIDHNRRLVSLTPLSIGTTGTISFFASCNVSVATSIAEKGTTKDFYTVSNTGVPEIDPLLSTVKKYGPGKRVTLSYKALPETPELGEVSVIETGATDATTAKKLYVKCFKKPYFESATFSPNPDNALVDGKKLYLAVNNGDHGTIDYTVYTNVGVKTILQPTATYAKTIYGITHASTWVQDGLKVKSETEQESYDNYQLEKRLVKVSLPDKIKAPAAVTKFSVGIGKPLDLEMIPVYITGLTITENDKQFKLTPLNNIWFAPINIGQTKLPKVGAPSATGGNLYQWGRRQPFQFGSPTVFGPLSLSDKRVDEDCRIIFKEPPYDWCIEYPTLSWNAGTDEKPEKSENDPCPAGWRIPSLTEWKPIANTSIFFSEEHLPETPSLTSNGTVELIEYRSGVISTVIFQMSGCLDHKNSTPVDPGKQCRIWLSCSASENRSPYYVLLCKGSFHPQHDRPSSDCYHIRCIQE